MRKTFVKVAPYVAAILAGLLFTFVGLSLGEDVKAILLSISAAFYAIPLIYLFYRVALNLSESRLNKEAFDYAKMQIDREVLSITLQLSKMVHRLDENDRSPKAINAFLSLEKNELKQVISRSEYLGFQLMKKWDVAENNLHEVLKNAFILQRLEDDQIIAVISIVKSLRHLESIQSMQGLYSSTGTQATSYRIISGRELDENNTRFPDRYLLLMDLGNGKAVVSDFGDFAQYNVNQLLNTFVVDKRCLEMYCDAVFELLGDIKSWISSTGGEFLVDTKMFRIGQTLAYQSKP